MRAMKWFCVGLACSLMGCGMAVSAETPPEKPEAELTVRDLDRQIQMLRDSIDKYESLAKSFDRKAASLQSHDYNGYRSATGLRDECRGIAEDLSSHLLKLEQQRADMLSKQKTEK